MQPDLITRLPNYFLAGVMKCGTTSLASYLDQHPQVFVSKPKEPHFFSGPLYDPSRVENYLNSFFRGADGKPARIDASAATFSFSSRSIPHLCEVYGDRPPKFIIIFREPVARAWSHYLHTMSEGREVVAPHIAFKTRESAAEHTSLPYFTFGLYATQLQTWLQIFPRGNFHYLLTDDLADSRSAYLTKILQFLDVDPSVRINVSKRYNPAARLRSARLARLIHDPPAFLRRLARLVVHNEFTRKNIRLYLRGLLRKRDNNPVPLIPPEVAATLRELYRDEILRLADMIDRDLSHWLVEPVTDAPQTKAAHDA